MLVVDDEPSIRMLLDVALEQHGFDVRSVADATVALDAVREWDPEVVLLDVMMPKMDGITLLPMLRRLTEAPIIFLTARGDVPDRVEGLSAGADDYIAKPFDMSELVARLTSALRRPTLRSVEQLRFKDLEIDLAARTVHRAGREIDLTRREFELLTVLARRPKRVFTRFDLIELAWGDESDVTTATVETFVSNLRAKVDAAPLPALIHTVRGVGYTLR